jgi:hypothetical protein
MLDGSTIMFTAVLYSALDHMTLSKAAGSAHERSQQSALTKSSQTECKARHCSCSVAAACLQQQASIGDLRLDGYCCGNSQGEGKIVEYMRINGAQFASLKVCSCYAFNLCITVSVTIQCLVDAIMRLHLHA